MAESVNLNKSVKLLLEHSIHLNEFDHDMGNFTLDEKLQKLKFEISNGLKDGSIVSEMQAIVYEIEDIQKDLQIQKVKNAQNKAALEYEQELDSEWVFINDSQASEDVFDSTVTSRLILKYREVCENINIMRKPIKPVFIILQWLITVYTTGVFSIIPILLKLLSQ